MLPLAQQVLFEEHSKGIRYIVDKGLSPYLTELHKLVIGVVPKEKQIQIKNIFTITLSTSNKKVLAD